VRRDDLAAARQQILGTERVAVARVALDQPFLEQVCERPPERLARDAEPSGKRGKPAAAGAGDLGEHGHRPAVV
jgi:hypothetical protein